MQSELPAAAHQLPESLGQSLVVGIEADRPSWQPRELVVTELLAQLGGGHEEVVGVLLEAGAEVNARSRRGMTALMQAAGRGHKGTVVLLLEADADVTLKDAYGWTALTRAKRSCHYGIVDLLEAAAGR